MRMTDLHDFRAPNGLRLSGARMRVRCSRGLGDTLPITVDDPVFEREAGCRYGRLGVPEKLFTRTGRPVLQDDIDSHATAFPVRILLKELSTLHEGQIRIQLFLQRLEVGTFLLPGKMVGNGQDHFTGLLVDTDNIDHFRVLYRHTQPFVSPNVLRLSGARMRVRCSRGLGDRPFRNMTLLLPVREFRTEDGRSERHQRKAERKLPGRCYRADRK